MQYSKLFYQCHLWQRFIASVIFNNNKPSIFAQSEALLKFDTEKRTVFRLDLNRVSYFKPKKTGGFRIAQGRGEHCWIFLENLLIRYNIPQNQVLFLLPTPTVLTHILYRCIPHPCAIFMPYVHLCMSLIIFVSDKREWTPLWDKFSSTEFLELRWWRTSRQFKRRCLVFCQILWEEILLFSFN